MNLGRPFALTALFLILTGSAGGQEAATSRLDGLKYSTQKFVLLDPGERVRFRLKNGERREIRLVAVKERRDPVIKLVRGAEVDVEIDGEPLRLKCAPYVMPTEVKGLRILADTTSAWIPLPKRVQFSVWDASDPIVDTDQFVFPLRNYRLFSHGIQCYNEPVHLGAGDGDPGRQVFYHNYGIDLGGDEGRAEVVSAVDGKVFKIWEWRGKPSSVFIRDDQGLIWEFGHLDSISPGIRVGAAVAKGGKIGMLGKTGYSGNFAHLHVGTFFTPEDLEADRRNRRLNLYPWIVAAYQAQWGKDLYAVARPHHTIFEGETVRFDGTSSLAFGSRITSYRWELPDGRTVEGAAAEQRFEKPGVYIATLRVEDAKGRRDVDFCKVKVFSKSRPEAGLPFVYVTHSPSENTRVDQEVSFRLWIQGRGKGPITLDFGDGTVIRDYESYRRVGHAFKNSGIHIVTARVTLNGVPITQKRKVVVSEK